MCPEVVRATFGNPANVTETFASFMCVRGTCTKPVCVSEGLRVQGRNRSVSESYMRDHAFVSSVCESNLPDSSLCVSVIGTVASESPT